MQGTERGPGLVSTHLTNLSFLTLQNYLRNILTFSSPWHVLHTDKKLYYFPECQTDGLLIAIPTPRSSQTPTDDATPVLGLNPKMDEYSVRALKEDLLAEKLSAMEI